MLQLTDAITDEELGGTPFVILRSFYRKSEGETRLVREDRYETIGPIHPAKMEEIQLLPEEYRHETVLIIHSPVSLSPGRTIDDLNFIAPDRILYQQQLWRVISIRDWSAFGFCKAFIIRNKEESETT